MYGLSFSFLHNQRAGILFFIFSWICFLHVSISLHAALSSYLTKVPRAISGLSHSILTSHSVSYKDEEAGRSKGCQGGDKAFGQEPWRPYQHGLSDVSAH